jgi:Protein of unknown function (DUF2388).
MKSALLLVLGIIATISQARAESGPSYQSTFNPDSVSASANVTSSPTLSVMYLSDVASDRTLKLIINAREDAQAYVASEGQIFGVKLAAAIAALRYDAQELQATDLEIALLISAQ